MALDSLGKPSGPSRISTSPSSLDPDAIGYNRDRLQPGIFSIGCGECGGGTLTGKGLGCFWGFSRFCDRVPGRAHYSTRSFGRREFQVPRAAIWSCGFGARFFQYPKSQSPIHCQLYTPNPKSGLNKLGIPLN